MSRGAGLYLAPSETNPVKVNEVVRQLVEGRSNAVGTFTITDDGVATTTVVSAPTCGPGSAIIPFPVTDAASTFWRGNRMYIAEADIIARQFTVTHATTSTANITFMWVCLG